MTKQTWLKFANQAGLWLLGVLAMQGVMYHWGSTPLPLTDVVIITAGGWVVTWIMLRINPNYYDGRRARREAEQN